MSCILDASAMLALIFDEPGADLVAPVARGSSLLSVNFSEVVQRVIAIDGIPERADEAVDRLEINVVPFDRRLGRVTAELRERTAFMGASFADRACLAMGVVTGLPILSSDRDWGKLDLGIDIRLIR
ncbi:MAG: type II toxin-antitoxin system VapC family toxin [Novosphingobium sp.]